MVPIASIKSQNHLGSRGFAVQIHSQSCDGTAAAGDEVKGLRQENERLKQLVADLSVANMLLKKSQS